MSGRVSRFFDFSFSEDEVCAQRSAVGGHCHAEVDPGEHVLLDTTGPEFTASQRADDPDTGSVESERIPCRIHQGIDIVEHVNGTVEVQNLVGEYPDSGWPRCATRTARLRPRNSATPFL